jgi:hypothetical protein
MSDLLKRLEVSQKVCFDAGQHIAAMDIQSARSEICRLTSRLEFEKRSARVANERAAAAERRALVEQNQP